MITKTLSLTTLLIALFANAATASEITFEATGPAQGYDPGGYFGAGPFPDDAVFTHRIRIDIDSCSNAHVVRMLVTPQALQRATCLMTSSFSKYDQRIVMPWRRGELSVSQTEMYAVLEASGEPHYEFVIGGSRSASADPWALVGKTTTLTPDELTWTNASFYYGSKAGYTIYEGGFDELRVSIPVPATYSLLLLGAVGLWGAKRRKRGDQP